jgi:hypothetical protein
MIHPIPTLRNFQISHNVCFFVRFSEYNWYVMDVKGKGRIHLRTGHEGLNGGVEVQLYSFLNLGGRWEWVVNATPRPRCRRERSGTHCIGSWVGPTAGVDGCGNSRPPPGFDSRTIQPVAIPTHT